MKVKVKKRTSSRDPENVSEFTEAHAQALKKFVACFEEINSQLIARTEELNALQMAVLTKSHILFHGEPGIAKSMLCKMFMERITDCPTVFFKQCNVGTELEDLVGPLNIPLFNQGVYEYNTTGRIPEATFVILDELYRAPKKVLDVLLEVLNERTFHNGVNEMRCPLSTVMGTTNFKDDTLETEAFRDRWLIEVEVSSIVSVEDKVKLLKLANEKASNQINKTISHNDIELLQNALDLVDLDPHLFSEIVMITDNYIDECTANNLAVSISDRRRCEALKCIKASALLDGRLKVEMEDLGALQYAYTRTGALNYGSHFTSVFSVRLREYEKLIRDRKTLEASNKLITDLEAEWKRIDKSSSSTSMDREKMKVANVHLMEKLKTAASQCTNSEIKTSFRELYNICENLNTEVRTTLGEFADSDYETEDELSDRELVERSLSDVDDDEFDDVDDDPTLPKVKKKKRVK